MSLSVTLVHPPHAKASEPGPGVLVLAEHLRRLGRDVRVVDANLRVQEALLSPARLAREVDALLASGASGPAVTSGRRAARRISAALDSLRSPRTYESRGPYDAALSTVEQAYRLLSRRGRVRISISDLEAQGHSPLSSRDLLSAAREPDALGLPEELRAAAAELLAGAPEVVGFSLTYLSQALPSFALAGLLRALGYRGLLVLGGALPTCWGTRLEPESPLFELWDGIVLGPGESALEALTSGEEFRPGAAPGLLLPSRGLWSRQAPARGATLCFEPELDGIAWDRYLSPGGVLPLATSRGCYWRKCAFCPEAAAPEGGHRAADADALVRTILRARDSHGISRVHFTDDAIPPALLHRVAKGLRGKGIAWYGFVRPETALLSGELAEELAASGCAMLQLGIESASQRLLDLLGKGTRVEHAGPILSNLSQAGIRTFVYLLFGCPSETEAEAEATLAWAVEHSRDITFLNLSLMNLPEGSAPAVSPSRYGVAGIEPLGGERDLSLYVGFSEEGGLPRSRARRLLEAARGHPALRPIVRRLPAGFTANHAAWCPL